MGYEIIYKDGVNSTTSIKRIAPGFSSFSNKTCTSIKLQYNEHLTNIDIIYNQDEIKYIEILTSKGESLKVGTQIENGYTSLNKVDITQRNYAPIIAFETTFSKDSLKELFIYRCPVRITKRKKKQELTVMEVNHLKAAPNLQRLSKAQENLNLITNFTRKGISSMRVIKTWQAFVQKAKQQGSINASTTIDTSSIRLENLVSPKKSQEALMEEQEYGVDDEEDKEEAKKEEEKEKEKEKKLAAKRKSRASIRIFNPFGTRKGSNSPTNSQEKNNGSKEESFESQIKKIAQTFFGKKNNSGENSPPLKENGKDEVSSSSAQDKKEDEIIFSSSKLEAQKQETLKERTSKLQEGQGSSKWKFFSTNMKRKLKALFILNDIKKKKNTEHNVKTEGIPIKFQFSLEGENENPVD